MSRLVARLLSIGAVGLAFTATLIGAVQAQDGIVLDQPVGGPTAFAGQRILALALPVDGGIVVATDVSPGLFEAVSLANEDYHQPVSACAGSTLPQFSSGTGVALYSEPNGLVWWVRSGTSKTVMRREPGNSCWANHEPSRRIRDVQFSKSKLLFADSDGLWFDAVTEETAEPGTEQLPLRRSVQESLDWGRTILHTFETGKETYLADQTGVYRVQNDLSSPASLVAQLPFRASPTALVVDDEGIVWLGTSDGLIRIATTNWQPVNLPSEEADITTIVPNTAFGVSRLDGGSDVYQMTASGWQQRTACFGEDVERDDYVIRSIVEMNRSIAVTTNRGLFYLDEDGTCRPALDLGDDVRHAVLHDGDLWALRVDGLYVDQGNTGDFRLEIGRRGILSFWFSDDGQLWITEPHGLPLKLDPQSADSASTDSEGIRGNGVGIGDGHIVSNGTLEQLELSGDSEGTVPFSFQVRDIEPVTGSSSRAWVASDNGLWLVDFETGRKSQFGEADGLPSSNINDLTVDGSTLWISTDAGVVIHEDDGVPPVLVGIDVKSSGVACDDCDANQIHFDSDAAVISWTASDSADWQGLVAELKLSGSDMPIESEADNTFRIDVQPGKSYRGTILLYDRHFNASEYALETFQVQEIPIATQAKRLVTNPLSAVTLAAFAFICYVLFARWRRAGQASVRDMRLHIASATEREGRTHICGELAVDRPRLLRALRPREFVSEGSLEWTAVGISSTGIEELRADAGRQLLGAALGNEGATHISRVLSSPLTSDARLRVDFADELTREQTRWLPWEALADDSDRLGSRGLAIARGVAAPEPQRRKSTDLRVLGIRAHCRGAEDLGLWAEHRHEIDAAFADHAHVEFRDCIADGEHAFEDLPDWLAEGWDIVHIYGHGETDIDFGGFVQFPLRSERGKKSQPGKFVTGAELQKAFASAPRPPLLVVIAACRTSNPTQETTLLPGPAEHLVANNVSSYAIGFAFDFDQPKILEFVKQFYPQIANGLQVDIAAARARNALGDPHEQAAIRLYAGPQTSVLYERT